MKDMKSMKKDSGMWLFCNLHALNALHGSDNPE
jgi:hypothetical protein